MYVHCAGPAAIMEETAKITNSALVWSSLPIVTLSKEEEALVKEYDIPCGSVELDLKNLENFIKILLSIKDSTFSTIDKLLHLHAAKIKFGKQLHIFIKKDQDLWE